MTVHRGALGVDGRDFLKDVEDILGRLADVDDHVAERGGLRDAFDPRQVRAGAAA